MSFFDPNSINDRAPAWVAGLLFEEIFFGIDNFPDKSQGECLGIEHGLQLAKKYKPSSWWPRNPPRKGIARTLFDAVKKRVKEAEPAGTLYMYPCVGTPTDGRLGIDGYFCLRLEGAEKVSVVTFDVTLMASKEFRAHILIPSWTLETQARVNHHAA